MTSEAPAEHVITQEEEEADRGSAPEMSTGSMEQMTRGENEERVETQPDGEYKTCRRGG